MWYKYGVKNIIFPKENNESLQGDHVWKARNLELENKERYYFLDDFRITIYQIKLWMMLKISNISNFKTTHVNSHIHMEISMTVYNLRNIHFLHRTSMIYNMSRKSKNNNIKCVSAKVSWKEFGQCFA